MQMSSGQTASLHIGPCSLHLHRASDEWLLSWERKDNGEELARAEHSLSNEGLKSVKYNRYVFHSPQGQVTMKPVLADRPVVIRPRQPVFVLPGEDTTLYLSSPVWIRIAAGSPPQTLDEIPVLHLSDTWFGPSTREGELCYAARTHARNHLEEVPLRPHRAVTPVRIRNRSGKHLPIEKLSLPVPLLSVFGRDDGSLWTEGVSLTRTSDDDMAELKLNPGPPRDAPRAVLLSGPRQQPDRSGLVVRAFSGLFG